MKLLYFPITRYRSNTIANIINLLLLNDAIRKANENNENNLQNEFEYYFTICNGSPVSDTNVCIQKSIYEQVLLGDFWIDINVFLFRSSKRWFEGTKLTMLSRGEKWSEKLERDVKHSMVNAIPVKINDIYLAIIYQKSGFINGVVGSVNSVSVSKKPLYHYRIHSNTISSSYKVDFFRQLLDVHDELSRLLISSSYFSMASGRMSNRYISASIDAIANEVHPDNKHSIIQKCRDIKTICAHHDLKYHLMGVNLSGCSMSKKFVITALRHRWYLLLYTYYRLYWIVKFKI